MLDNPKPNGLTRREWLAIVGAGSAAGLAGCTGGDGDDGGDGGDDGGGSTPTSTPDPADLPPVHFLTDYNNDAWQARWEEELAPAFKDETGIDVEVEYTGMSGGGQEQRVATLIQSGDAPDISTGTFDQVADLWSNGHLRPVDDVINNIASVAGEMALAPFQDSNGNTFLVPHGTYVSNFHYRQDVYDDLGLSPPETLEETLENARVIDESDKDIRGYGLAGQKTGKSQDEYLVYAANMGIPPLGLRWKDSDAQNELEIHWPEEEITYLLQWFEDISQYSPDPTSIGWASSIQNYLGGQFAQQYHLNIWPQGIAAVAGIPPIANNTGVKALPHWNQIEEEENWQYEPTPDGFAMYAEGANTPGAAEWLSWLYGGDIQRTANQYSAEPSRFLPTWEGVIDSDTYTNFSIWQDNPHLYDDLLKTRDQIWGEHYGNVPEADLGSSAVAVYVARQWFYGEMVNLVVTGTNTVQEAYEWGRGRLEQRFQEGKDRFGG